MASQKRRGADSPPLSSRLSPLHPEIRFENDEQQQLYAQAQSSLQESEKVGGVRVYGDSDTTVRVARTTIEALKSVAQSLMDVVDVSGIVDDSSELQCRVNEGLLHSATSPETRENDEKNKQNREAIYSSNVEEIAGLVSNDEDDDFRTTARGAPLREPAQEISRELQDTVDRIRCSVRATATKTQKNAKVQQEGESNTAFTRHGPIMEAYLRAIEAEEKARQTRVAEKAPDSSTAEDTGQPRRELTAIKRFALHDEQRREEIRNLIEKAEHPAELVPIIWQLCDEERKCEFQLLYSFLHVEQLGLHLQFSSSELSKLQGDVRSGVLGNVQKLQEDINFFQGEREWLYNKLCYYDAQARMHPTQNTDVAYVTQLEETNRKLRQQVVSCRLQVAAVKRKAAEAMQKLQRESNQSMLLAEQLTHMETRYYELHRKYLSQFSQDKPTEDTTAQQAAELENSLGVRRHYLVKDAVGLRVAMDRLRNDKSRFSAEVIKQSGVTHVTQEMRDAFVAFIESNHDSLIRTAADLYTTLVEDIAPFVDIELASRWTAKEDPVVILLSKKLTLPGPYALYGAAADVLRGNWDNVKKNFVKSAKVLFEGFSKMSKEIEKTREGEDAHLKEASELYDKVRDLNEKLLKANTTIRALKEAAARPAEPKVAQDQPTEKLESAVSGTVSPIQEDSAAELKAKDYADKYNGLVTRLNVVQDREREKTRRIVELENNNRTTSQEKAAMKSRISEVETEKAEEVQRCKQLQAELQQSAAEIDAMKVAKLGLEQLANKYLKMLNEAREALSRTVTENVEQTATGSAAATLQTNEAKHQDAPPLRPLPAAPVSTNTTALQPTPQPSQSALVVEAKETRPQSGLRNDRVKGTLSQQPKSVETRSPSQLPQDAAKQQLRAATPQQTSRQQSEQAPSQKAPPPVQVPDEAQAPRSADLFAKNPPPSKEESQVATRPIQSAAPRAQPSAVEHQARDETGNVQEPSTASDTFRLPDAVPTTQTAYPESTDGDAGPQQSALSSATSDQRSPPDKGKVCTSATRDCIPGYDTQQPQTQVQLALSLTDIPAELPIKPLLQSIASVAAPQTPPYSPQQAPADVPPLRPLPAAPVSTNTTALQPTPQPSQSALVVEAKETRPQSGLRNDRVKGTLSQQPKSVETRSPSQLPQDAAKQQLRAATPQQTSRQQSEQAPSQKAPPPVQVPVEAQAPRSADLFAKNPPPSKEESQVAPIQKPLGSTPATRPIQSAAPQAQPSAVEHQARDETGNVQEPSTASSVVEQKSATFLVQNVAPPLVMQSHVQPNSQGPPGPCGNSLLLRPINLTLTLEESVRMNITGGVQSLVIAGESAVQTRACAPNPTYQNDLNTVHREEATTIQQKVIVCDIGVATETVVSAHKQIQTGAFQAPSPFTLPRKVLLHGSTEPQDTRTILVQRAQSPTSPSSVPVDAFAQTVVISFEDKCVYAAMQVTQDPQQRSVADKAVSTDVPQQSVGAICETHSTAQPASSQVPSRMRQRLPASAGSAPLTRAAKQREQAHRQPPSTHLCQSVLALHETLGGMFVELSSALHMAINRDEPQMVSSVYNSIRSLQNSLTPSQSDLLAVDAFASEAIKVDIAAIHSVGELVRARSSYAQKNNLLPYFLHRLLDDSPKPASVDAHVSTDEEEPNIILHRASLRQLIAQGPPRTAGVAGRSPRPVCSALPAPVPQPSPKRAESGVRGFSRHRTSQPSLRPNTAALFSSMKPPCL